MSERENELKVLRSDYDKSIYKASKLESALNEIRNLHSRTKQEIKTEYDALRAKYDAKCEEFYALKQSLDKQISAGLHRLDMAKNKITELESKLNETTVNKHDLESQLKAFEANRIINEKKLNEMKQANDCLNQRMIDISQKLAAKEKEFDVFKRVNFSELSQKYKELLIKYDEECKDLNERMKRLKESHESKMDALRVCNDGNLKKLECVNEEMNEYKLKSKEIEIKCTFLEQTNQNLSFCLDDMKHDNAVLNERNEALSEQMNELKEQLFAIESEKNEIEERVNKMNEENERLYEANMTKEDEMRQMDENMNDLKISCDDLIEQNKDIKEEMDALQDKYDSMKEEYTELQRKCHSKLKKYEMFKNEQQKNFEKIELKLSKRNGEFDALTKRLNESTMECLNRMNLLNAQQRELDVLKADNASKDKKIEKMQQNVHQMEEQSKMNAKSSELLIKTLQNNLKQLQQTKSAQFDLLMEHKEILKRKRFN